jgi:type I restriction enzyme M protein
MNLYLRGIDGNIQLGDSIRSDEFPNLRADTVITNPPFNMSEWGQDTVSEDDPRFKYGLPPSSNANLAFLQHMLHHTSEDGTVGTVMAKGSLSAGGKEAEIRKAIVENDLVDAIIVLSDQLFYTTEIPVSLWIVSKSKGKDDNDERSRSGETLFVDARDIYKQEEVKQKVLTEEHIKKISGIVKSYQESESEYEDIAGYCSTADIEEIAENDYNLIPGRYVGVGELQDDGIAFEPRMEELSSELRREFRDANELQKEINERLHEIGF